MVRKNKKPVRKEDQKKQLDGTNKILHDGLSVLGVVCLFTLVVVAITATSDGVDGMVIFNKIIESIKQLFVF